MSHQGTDYLVCEKCRIKFEELLKEISNLQAEKKKFEELYKSKCRQELRNKAEIQSIKSDFENRLYQLKEDDQLGLIKYMSSRIAVQDKLIYDTTRELTELKKKWCNSANTPEKDIRINEPINSFDESLDKSRERLNSNPTEKKETKISSPQKRPRKLQAVPPNQRLTVQLRSAHSFRIPAAEQTQKRVFQRERHGSINQSKTRFSQPPLPASASLQRHFSFRDANGIAASRIAISRSNQESSVRASSNLSSGPSGKKDYLVSLENALRMANKEKILLERQMISHMDSMTTSNTEVASPPRQQSIHNRYDDRPTTTGSDFEDRTLFEALKDTNEALKAELARLTPFEQQVKEMTEQIEQLKLRECSLQSLVDNLSDTNNTLIKEKEHLQTQVSEKDSVVQQISREFEKNIQASKQKVKSLLNEKDTLHNLQQESNETITAMRKTILDLQQENQKIAEAKIGLETVEKNQQAEIEKLKQANENIMSELNAAKQSSATECSKCLEKDTIIAKQSRQIELLRGLTKNAIKPTVTVGTNTIPPSSPLSGQKIDNNTKKKISFDRKDASSSTDSAIDITTPETSRYSAFQKRSAADVTGSPKKTGVVDQPTSSDDNLDSKSFTLNLSEDFRVLRETMQESEHRHKQLEKDYERTLLRMNMKDEELDRLRRV